MTLEIFVHKGELLSNGPHREAVIAGYRVSLALAEFIKPTSYTPGPLPTKTFTAPPG